MGVAEPEKKKETRKQCKACCEAICVDATKCPYCGTFQNWKSYINFSSTMLAMLTALISVSLATWSNIEPYLKPSQLSITSVGVNDAQLRMLGRNPGIEDSVVEEIRLVYMLTGEDDPIEFSMVPTNKRHYLLKAESNTQFELRTSELEDLAEGLVQIVEDERDEKEIVEDILTTMGNLAGLVEQAQPYVDSCHLFVSIIDEDDVRMYSPINLMDRAVVLNDFRSIKMRNLAHRATGIPYPELPFDEDDLQKNINNQCEQLLFETTAKIGAALQQKLMDKN